MASVPDLKDLVFPIVRREPGNSGYPLRRNIDYMSSIRSTLVVDMGDLPCPACGMLTLKGANEGCPACVVRFVQES